MGSVMMTPASVDSPGFGLHWCQDCLIRHHRRTSLAPPATLGVLRSASYGRGEEAAASHALFVPESVRALRMVLIDSQPIHRQHYHLKSRCGLHLPCLSIENKNTGVENGQLRVVDHQNSLAACI